MAVLKFGTFFQMADNGTSRDHKPHEVGADPGIHELVGTFVSPALSMCAVQAESVSTSSSSTADGDPTEPLLPFMGPKAPCDSGASGHSDRGPAGFHDAASYQQFLDYYAQYTQNVYSLLARADQQPEEESRDPPDSKRVLVEEWLKRPARVQVDAKDLQEHAHLEGHDEYNIWYGRHDTKRSNRMNQIERDAALYRCDPARDAGYTAAGTGGGGFFCAFFAKGCCTKGSDCQYRHAIPVRDDEGKLEWSRDVFGRERHRDHRDDMGGVGSFNHECKTLFVGGLKVDPMESDGLKKLEAFLWEEFGIWGDVKTVRVIPKKLIGFVTYEYRVQAEFAKVAMADQNVGKYGGLLSVKWAHQDGNEDRRTAVAGDPRKRLRVAETAGPLQGTDGTALVREALGGYCAAWQHYWEAANAARVRGDAPSGEWLSGAEGETEEGDNARRLQGILSRVDELSSADFLAACENASHIC